MLLKQLKFVLLVICLSTISHSAAYAISADAQHQIKPIPDQTVIVGEELQFSIEAEAGVAYQMTSIEGLNFPDGAYLSNANRDFPAIFSKKAKFHWSPDIAQAGISPYGAVYWVSLKATTSYFSLADWGGLTDRLTKPVKVKITVLPRKPPKFDPVPDQVIQPWQAVKFTVSAKKPDGSKALILNNIHPHSDTQIPKPMNNSIYIFDNKTGIFQWHSSLENAGKTYGIQFRSIDGGPADKPAMLDVKIIVRPTKKVVIKNIADQTVEAGKTLTLEVVGFNEDQSRAAYHNLKFIGTPVPSSSVFCVSARGNANFQQHSPGTFTWNACSEDIGKTFTAQASACPTPSTCSPELQGTLDFKVKVIAASRLPQVVRPDPKPVKKPVIKNIGDRTMKAGETLTFHVVGFNEDQTTVAYYDAKFVGPDIPPVSPWRLGSPAFVQHDAGTFTWTSCTDDIGKTYKARAFASSVSSFAPDITGTLDFKIMVVSPSSPPPVVNPPKKSPPQVVAPDPDRSKLPEPKSSLPVDPVVTSPDSKSDPENPLPEPSHNNIVVPEPVMPAPEPEPLALPDSCTFEGKTKSTAEIAKSMEGVWDSRDSGTVYVKASGSRIEGTYTNNQGRFFGTVNSDCLIEGEFVEYRTDPLIDRHGTFKMATSEDSHGYYVGEYMDDEYPEEVYTGWGWKKFQPDLTPKPDWSSRAINPGLSFKKGHKNAVCPNGCTGAELTAIAQAFSGTWDTIEGTITASAAGLMLEGPIEITGKRGKIRGQIQPDGSLRGEWSMPDSHGEFIFWIDPTGRDFIGNYTDSQDPGFWSEGWTGKKTA